MGLTKRDDDDEDDEDDEDEEEEKKKEEALKFRSGSFLPHCSLALRYYDDRDCDIMHKH